MSRRTVTLDVREDIRNGREPFVRIMNAVSALKPDEQLRLVAPFEPTPLFAVLGREGFQHHSQPIGAGDWEVLFTRQPVPLATELPLAPPPKCSQRPPAISPAEIVEVDARRLDPPQPMVKILETLTTLPAGAELRARTDRQPMHLYALLEERGFVGVTEEQPDGSFLTHVRRC